MSQSSNLVTACLQYLALRNIPAWRNNAGRFHDGHGRRRITAGVVGGPDILGVLAAGRMLAVEAKTGSGRLSPAQKAWAEAARRAGALYLVARSIDDLRNGLAEAGYPEGRP